MIGTCEVLADQGDDFLAVKVGQAQVQDHEIGALHSGRFSALGAGFGFSTTL